MNEQPDWTWENVKEFWRTDDLKNIIPLTGEEFPEGFDVYQMLAMIRHFTGAQDVVELGCGYGRLAPIFDPQHYQGLDINPQAITAAEQRCPAHRFRAIETPKEIPYTELILAYTVLLHIPDSELPAWASEMDCRADWIVVAEILGRDWRQPTTKVPVFNRERQDFVDAFANHELVMEIRRPYKRYAGNLELSQQYNTDISFLIFKARNI